MAKKKKKTTKKSSAKHSIPDAGFLSPGIRPKHGRDYVVVELRHDSQVALSPTGFAAPAAVERTSQSLNDVLNSFDIREVTSHFGMKASQIRARSTAAPASMSAPVSSEFAQAGFVRVVPKSGKDCEALVSKLNKSKAVWKAVIAPQPVPAGAPDGDSPLSRSFEPCQGYLHDAPNGIGAMRGWDEFNAKGKGVTICDIEGNWKLDHEDLPTLKHIGGDLINDLGWRNHGTAVVGEMLAKPGRSGCVGISHMAKGFVHSAMINGIFSAETAIANATKKLKKGDVILIELHAPSPITGKFIAMQYWDAVFSAIRAATDKGITVVEAAGNGNENFDQAIYRNSGLQRDAGAIVVGAGVPPTNYFGFFGNEWGFSKYETLGNPRSRIFFSNYGKIVNVQAWGWHVTTTGYGDAQGGSDEAKWQTHRFSGTSSASPIVTAAVACIQGHAKAKKGTPLAPSKVREIMIKTGTKQEAGPGVPLSQHIGPQPNLAKALKSV